MYTVIVLYCDLLDSAALEAHPHQISRRKSSHPDIPLSCTRWQLPPSHRGHPQLFSALLVATLKPQSIKVYMYNVRNLHLEHGFPDPLPDALQLCRLLGGIKRLKTLACQSLHPSSGDPTTYFT